MDSLGFSSCKAGRWGLLAGALVVGIAAPASAQMAGMEDQRHNPCDIGEGTGNVRCFDLQLFTPPPSVGETFTIDATSVPRHLSFVFGLHLNGAAGLLTTTPAVPDGAMEPDSVSIVPSRFQAELLAAMGLFGVIELGLALPLVISSAPDTAVTNDRLADPALETSTGVGLGDIRFNAKVPIFQGPLSLAASTEMAFGLDGSAAERFMSTGYWSLFPSALIALEAGDLTIASELGYRLRRLAAIPGAFSQDDEIHLALGGRYDITDDFAAILETQLRIGVGASGGSPGNPSSDPTMNIEPDDSITRPMEIDGGVRWTLFEGLTLDLGVGTGILRGYGAPAFRGFLIARYATEPQPCDAGPEDYDGFDDGDFCADPDNDLDGFADDVDQCPNDAEDQDGFLDDDGCPDNDNDADGVRDADDQCASESEDLDGFQDTDGCPEADNDEDGLEDGVDQCPMEPEDLDAYQDEDGCPEPGPGRATVTVTDTRILISERIYFDFDTETIRSISQPLLDQVAGVIQRIPGARRIRVDGYTDNAGEPGYNLDLSYRRARSVVEYLSGRGVPRNRLEFCGYGEENPVAPNDSAEGRALNRRVEFTILEEGERGCPRRNR